MKYHLAKIPGQIKVCNKVTEDVELQFKRIMMEKKDEKDIMSIVSEDGSIEEVEVILAFEFKDNKKEYIVYTKNEKDDNGNVTVYVSNVNREDGEPKLYGVEDEEEWSRIKDVLRELSKDVTDEEIEEAKRQIEEENN